MKDSFSTDPGRAEEREHGHGMSRVCIYCALYVYYYHSSSSSDHQALDPGGWEALPKTGQPCSRQEEIGSTAEASCLNADQECTASLEPTLALNPNPGVLLAIAGRENISLPCLMHHYDPTCFAFLD